MSESESDEDEEDGEDEEEWIETDASKVNWL